MDPEARSSPVRRVVRWRPRWTALWERLFRNSWWFSSRSFCRDPKNQNAVCWLWLRYFPVSLVGNTIWTSLIGMSVLGIFRTMLDVFFYAILLQVILSWVNPHSPISSVLDSLTKPILAPIQRLLPTAGGMDFSPVVALILIQMVNISVVKTLEVQLLNLYWN